VPLPIRWPLAHGIDHNLRTSPIRCVVRPSPPFLSLEIAFLSFPDFLWAHRSSNSSPLRPWRLLLCRLRPFVPQRKRGRKKGKRKCPIYLLGGIGFRGISLADRSLVAACFATHGPLPKRRPAMPWAERLRREWPIERDFQTMIWGWPGILYDSPVHRACQLLPSPSFGLNPALRLTTLHVSPTIW
jgi:hypothetical protein